MGRNDGVVEIINEGMDQVKLVANIARDDFYKARIQKLEDENQELRRRIDKEEEAYEYGDQMSKAVIAELEAHIAELEHKLAKLEQAFIREVTK